ncbi:MAG: glycosyltransferase [Actinomycetota bacterium]|nr:glycosyltransferase [Actinomycetota bacterium]
MGKSARMLQPLKRERGARTHGAGAPARAGGTLEGLTHARGGEEATPSRAIQRPRVAGKFLTVGSEKLLVRGVSYGTFRPGIDGVDYPPPRVVRRDFKLMAASGINTVRTYTVPPRWLLDLAQAHGLYVMVGLAWEQHVAFLDLVGTPAAIAARIRAGARAASGHPAVLCYAVGNEIPASIVRWHGRERVQRFLRRLYETVKAEDPTALVTYVNYPTTEYLDLSFLDLYCFNVYLEDQESFEAYLARLHNLAGDRPLILSEIGLDSRRHGLDRQAESVASQVATASRAGCAGAIVFSWTDEWYITHLGSDGQGVGGSEILDWDFGLTDRSRRPKPALAAVRAAFDDAPSLPDEPPRVSVVVCSLNGEATLRDCLDGCTSLDYPDYEVIVVDDGSTDATPDIARSYGVRVVSTPNRGLSSARNTGLQLATGTIVAYTDDDAWPDPHWLRYLVNALADSSHVAVGGPNLAPPGDGLVAHCVANSPGGPMQVLLSDSEAEHIPGCNMAFRREALEAIGGFDPRYRTAGDDVDVCWRLQERGGTIGFHGGAMVWHHRRNSLRAYWRQQKGYGRAEALLEEKWPERYNAAGHIAWTGRLYGGGLARALTRRRPRIYQGLWGSAPFQSVYQSPPGLLGALPQIPESYLMGSVLALLGFLGFVWPPLFAFAAIFGLLAIAWVLQAVRSAAPAVAARGAWPRWKVWGLTTTLHLAQPVARLLGRQRAGLTPWRRRGLASPSPVLRETRAYFTRRWCSADARLRELQSALSSSGAVVHLGGPFDRWDLSVRGGVLANMRILLSIEEHGAGMQMVRYRWWPVLSPAAAVIMLVLATLATVALTRGAMFAAYVLALLSFVVGGWTLWEVSLSAGEVLAALELIEGQEPPLSSGGP